MSNLPRILCTSIATLSALSIVGPSAKGALIDDFQTPGPFAVAGAHGDAGSAGPSFVTEGTNRFLRILSGGNGQHNSYTYELVAGDTGAFDRTVASFDFRIGGNAAADGLGFLLVPTELYGTSGTSTRPGVAEEPDLAGAFGLGIDMYSGINNISTHFNGAQMTEVDTRAFQDLDFRNNPDFHNVKIELDRIGNGTIATVTLTPNSLSGAAGTPVKIMETLMPNMLPYQYRVQLLGRTGGLNMIADLDNINVASSGPAFDPASLPQAPAAAAGHLFQDFDSTGTTFYRAIQVATSDPDTSRPGPLIKAPEPNNATAGHFLRLVNDGINGQNNRIIFNRAADGGSSNITEGLEFDVRFNSADGPADGMGLLFVPTLDVANPLAPVDIAGNAGFDIAEEPNLLGALGVGFDIYNNGEPDQAPSISLHWNGATVLETPFPAEFAVGSFHRYRVLRETVAGGLAVSIIGVPDINGTPGAEVTLVDKHFIAGATNYDYRVQFSGRTGGLDADHDLDNIRSFQVGRAQSATTRASFSPQALDATFKGHVLGLGAGPRVLNDGLDAPNGDYIRLVHDGSNSQSNVLSFDKQLDGSINGATGVRGEFTFRAASPTDQPADGFSIILTPTALYGDSGVGAPAAAGFIAEEPNAEGAFAIGFDLYNGGGIEFNEISAHWNGAVINNVDVTTALNLDNDVFNKVRFELQAVEGGALLNMSIIPDFYIAPGAGIVVFDDVLIPGLDLYDYRVEFAGRTGGLNMRVDLDDILVQTVPEPTSAALLAMGGLALGCFRRPRRRAA